MSNIAGAVMVPCPGILQPGRDGTTAGGRALEYQFCQAQYNAGISPGMGDSIDAQPVGLGAFPTSMEEAKAWYGEGKNKYIVWALGALVLYFLFAGKKRRGRR